MRARLHDTVGAQAILKILVKQPNQYFAHGRHRSCAPRHLIDKFVGDHGDGALQRSAGRRREHATMRCETALSRWWRHSAGSQEHAVGSRGRAALDIGIAITREHYDRRQTSGLDTIAGWQIP